MKLKRSFIKLLCIGIICIQTQVAAAGAMDSAPDKELGTGGTSMPYAPGQQLQQEEQNKDKDNEKYNEKENESPKQDKENAGVSQSLAVDPIVDPDFYKPTNKGGNDGLIDLGNTIIGAIQIIGTIIAVVTLMIIGFRYMFGSVEAKANYKETMIPYIIGAVMLFTIPNLLRVIYDLIKGINF